MDTKQFKKFLFNRIKKELERILPTEYKTYNFNSRTYYTSLKPISVSVINMIVNREVLILAQKYSGFDKKVIESLNDDEIDKYFTNNIEEFEKFSIYVNILNHFEFVEGGRYAHTSHHIYNFVKKHHLHAWTNILIKDYENTYEAKHNEYYVDYFYNNYKKLPIQIQNKGKTLYNKFEAINLLKKKEEALKMKADLEKFLPVNNQVKKIVKI